MNKLVIVAIALVAILGTGCKAISPYLTPDALTQEVSQGVRIGLDVYPAAAPEVALSRDVICSAATVTNVNPAAIVADLERLNITNAESKIIVDSALLIYEGVYALIGTNSTSQVQPYLAALCAGLTAGLPPANVNAPMAMRMTRPLLPPHLK